ncbi:hypothetical protein B0182_01210 [Moraxella bovis]|nr:hypothetical protein DQF64_03475 [Moraxella bovis]OOR92243.1 hypothetical protein B0182_01210 [Moraxella bovis]
MAFLLSVLVMIYSQPKQLFGDYWSKLPNAIVLIFLTKKIQPTKLNFTTETVRPELVEGLVSVMVRLSSP